MDLTQALNEIGNFYNLNPAHLIGYADEDNIGGFHFDETKRTYHTGSIWGVEGQILYALIRATKPDRIANLGTGVGCSLHHMALACHENGHGMVYTVDNGSGEEVRYLDKSRTERLKAHIHYETSDMGQWLSKQPDGSFDLIFEDWSHDPAMITEVWKLATRKLKPGGFMISHDSEHYIVGAQVLEGVVNSHVPPFGILRQLVEPSDCGLIYWVRDYGGVDRPDVKREARPEVVAPIWDDESTEYLDETPDESDIINYDDELTDEDLEMMANVVYEVELEDKLNSMTKAELVETYQGVELAMTMRKDEIIAAILDSEGYGE